MIQAKCKWRIEESGCATVIKDCIAKERNMKILQRKLFQMSVVPIVTLFMVPHVLAEEKIIQQEMLSFEKCLNVITISQDKLSVAPAITDVSDQKRVAIFTLVDGTLTIRCDGIEGIVTVSTNTN